jgi:hypothetical protein
MWEVNYCNAIVKCCIAAMSPVVTKKVNFLYGQSPTIA